MKKKYESPEIICSSADDIITTSIEVETEYIPFEAGQHNGSYQLMSISTPADDLYKID